MTRTAALLSALAALTLPAGAAAQTLGTFRWQLQPYCNVITVTITQVGGTYRVEGTDDQCGGGRDQASVQGMAFANPDGTIGFGLTIVTAPGGVPVHVDADMSVATASGTWRDDAGGTGSFAFAPVATAVGYPRPLPSAVVPTAIHLLTDGGVVANQNGAGTIPASGAGTRMMWYPGKAAFRAGSVAGTQWDEAQVGAASVALGLDTRATKPASVALGHNTAATGAASTALGRDAIASGTVATAIGRSAIAGGFAAVAMGDNTSASGDGSTALGVQTTASGPASLAVGGNTRASGTWSFAGGANSQATGNLALAFGVSAAAAGPASVALGTSAITVAAASGSFVFADNSSGTPFTSFTPGEFVVRASGGVGFYTNAAATTGAEMAPGGGSWAGLSDVNMKENFREVPGEGLLAKIAALPIREWNYTSQDPSIRHMGPTAQDFRAAFGLGDFPLRINTTDADGVALAGVKALEARTTALQAENAALRRELDQLRARLDAK